MFGYTVAGFGAKASRGINLVIIADDEGDDNFIAAFWSGLGDDDIPHTGSVEIPRSAGTSSVTLKAYSEVHGGSGSYSYNWSFVEGLDDFNVLSASASSSSSQNWTDLVLTASGGEGTQILDNTIRLRVDDSASSSFYIVDFVFTVDIS